MSSCFPNLNGALNGCVLYQVCLGTTGGWTEEPCEGHSHLPPLGARGKTTSLPPQASGGVFAIVIDASTIQYIDSVTAKALREVGVGDGGGGGDDDDAGVDDDDDGGGGGGGGGGGDDNDDDGDDRRLHHSVH
jgi:hypothetical protein